MIESLMCIGGLFFVMVALSFLGMGRISAHYDDECGADIAQMIAGFFFLLALMVLWAA